MILCSGFKEAIVKRHFDFISLCFCDWESSEEICIRAEQCRRTALGRFHNIRKINAIVETAFHVTRIGFGNIRRTVLEDPIGTLRRIPHIGPVTSFHLAKNLGMNTAKPDRHLSRFAASMGFHDAHDLCKVITDHTGEPVDVVDLILWRYIERFPHSF